LIGTVIEALENIANGGWCKLRFSALMKIILEQ